MSGSLEAFDLSAAPHDLRRPAPSRRPDTHELRLPDPAERAVVSQLRSLDESKTPDIDAAAGPVTAILQLISDDDLGTETVPRLLRMRRREHPRADIRFGAATDLAEFDDASFGVVVFSDRRIDDLTHVDRESALRDIERVLQPDGRFVYSTHNKNGSKYRRAGLEQRRGVRRFAGLRGRREVAASGVDGGAWAIVPIPRRGLSKMTHFITLEGLRAELELVGLKVAEQLDPRTGAALPEGGSASGEDYFQVVAQGDPVGNDLWLMAADRTFQDLSPRSPTSIRC